MFKLRNEDVILKTITKLLVPFVLMLGAHVVINGHISPGGGFSGGTILGAAIVLYAVAFGREETRRFFSFKTFTYLSVFALLTYGVAKGYSFMTGAAHIPSGIPIGTPGKIFSAGLILPLNIGVGIIVMSTIYLLYSLFNEGDV